MTGDQVVNAIAKMMRWQGVLGGVGGGRSAPPARPATELQLKIQRVNCIERVGWEATDWSGRDRMLYGGLGFDSTISEPPPSGTPSDAHYRKVAQFLIDTFDQDGQSKNYNPDKPFARWNLAAPGPWPRIFTGIIVLGEQDSGDEFPALLEKIWVILTPAVIAAVSALVVAYAGGAIGAVIGTEAAPGVGTAIGAALGSIIGFIVGAVIDTLRDDILESDYQPGVAVLADPVRFADFSGATTDVATVEFRRPGMSGIYSVDYYWQLA